MNRSENRRRALLPVLAAVLLCAAVCGFLCFRGISPADPPLRGKTVLLAGDSRSSTDYSFYRDLLQQKSGGTVLNLGASGKTAAYNASDAYFAVLRDNPHDFSIWLVGGNDDGRAGSVGTFSESSALFQQGEPLVEETDITADYGGKTFIQAVDHIMRKYKTLFYDFRTSESGRIPRMIFCTDLPQQRENGGTEWSRTENWERKRLAILECCEKNGVACLDLYRLCAFDMRFEPFYTEPTDFAHNRGVYYMDGLHPNQYGMDLITTLEVEEMKNYLLSLSPAS